MYRFEFWIRFCIKISYNTQEFFGSLKKQLKTKPHFFQKTVF